MYLTKLGECRNGMKLVWLIYGGKVKIIRPCSQLVDHVQAVATANTEFTEWNQGNVYCSLWKNEQIFYSFIYFL